MVAFFAVICLFGYVFFSVLILLSASVNGIRWKIYAFYYLERLLVCVADTSMPAHNASMATTSISTPGIRKSVCA